MVMELSLISVLYHPSSPHTHLLGVPLCTQSYLLTNLLACLVFFFFFGCTTQQSFHWVQMVPAACFSLRIGQRWRNFAGEMKRSLISWCWVGEKGKSPWWAWPYQVGLLKEGSGFSWEKGLEVGGTLFSGLGALIQVLSVERQSQDPRVSVFQCQGNELCQALE